MSGGGRRSASISLALAEAHKQGVEFERADRRRRAEMLLQGGIDEVFVGMRRNFCLRNAGDFTLGIGFGKLIAVQYYILPNDEEFIGDPDQWLRWLEEGLRDIEIGVRQALDG